jgi:small subunit ribosomal protein S8
MTTDPIADMFTRIRNGVRARLKTIDVPFSKFKERIAKVLIREGYLEKCVFLDSDKPSKRFLHLTLSYDERDEPVLSGIKRWSRPGLRRYLQSRRVPKVRNGLGIVLLTTSQGLLTDREARNRGVGGEPLGLVW